VSSQPAVLEKRPRVLLIAEAANPEWVSVPLEGWDHSRALSSKVDAHLVTQIRNREAILRAGLGESAFTTIDSEAVAAPLYKLANVLRGGTNKGWTTVTALSTLAYPWFERLVWRRFKDRLAAREFDLVHRLTPLSPTAPSLIAAKLARIGVPFVIGPLNGGVKWPPGFERARLKEREWLSYVRSAFKLLPGYDSTRRHAAAIVAGSLATLDEIPERWRPKCVYIPENGIDPSRFRLRTRVRTDGPLRAAFVGRLVPYKGADMLLEAAAPLVREGRVQLDILGDGPEMPTLRAIAAREKIDGGVRLDGWVAHEKLQERLSESEVLAFPSIREFGGGVVLEAMALGLAPVVVGYGGPGELVTPTTGIALPLGTRTEIVERLRRALAELAADRERVRTLGEHARQRIQEHFTWEAKAAQVLEVYRWVLGRRPGKPDFGRPLP
jgi:glycosyltransferase involved in cell wall biosynthesis